MEFHCDDEDIAELEVALGTDIPEELEALLRFSDGGTFRGPTRSIHLASSEEIAGWAAAGVMAELEALPFAQDDAGTILVYDTNGSWAGEEGAIFRVDMGRRQIHGYPVQDAHRVASSLAELLSHLAAGKDAW